MSAGVIKNAMAASIRETFGKHSGANQHTANKTMGQKPGAPTKGVVQVGAGVGGSMIPGGSVLSSALSGALGGMFGEIEDGADMIMAQLKTNYTKMDHQTRALADAVTNDILGLKQQLQKIRTKLKQTSR